MTSIAGGPAQTVQAAIEMISKVWGNLRVSGFYQTPAFPAGSGPDFVNAACVISTKDGAQTVLDALHEIEAQLGRERATRWGRRTIDLDLIGQGDCILPDTSTFDRWYNLAPEDQIKETPDVLILPHPRMQDRSFVLVPLADVAPNWTHPKLGKTVHQLLAARPDQETATVVPAIP